MNLRPPGFRLSPDIEVMHPEVSVFDRLIEAFETGDMEGLQNIAVGMQAQLDQQQALAAERLANQPVRIPILETEKGKAWTAARLARLQEPV